MVFPRYWVVPRQSEIVWPKSATPILAGAQGAGNTGASRPQAVFYGRFFNTTQVSFKRTVASNTRIADTELP